MEDYTGILNVAAEAARKAGDYVRDERSKGLHIDAKSRIDFVSDKDRMSEQMIRDAVSRNFPSHLFFGEESVYGESAEDELSEIRSFRDEDYIWVVDPIDGTVNYIHDFPQYAVSIGVVHRREIVVGVVYDPVRGEMYYAQKGCGAFLNGRRLHVTDTASTLDAMIDTSMPTNSMEMRRIMVRKLPPVSEAFQQVRVFNCAAIGLVSVACGRTDADYQAGIHLWDMAASVRIILEAGGKVTRIDGSPLDLTSLDILATNGLIHEETLRVLS